MHESLSSVCFGHGAQEAEGKEVILIFYSPPCPPVSERSRWRSLSQRSMLPVPPASSPALRRTPLFCQLLRKYHLLVVIL